MVFDILIQGRRHASLRPIGQQMSGFKIKVCWTRKTPDFAPQSYDRTHSVTMSGGFSYVASAAPDFQGKAELPNPEESLLAALATCHMLTFLAIAANSKLVVDSYEDMCEATLEKNENRKFFVKSILLRPKITFGGDKMPDILELKRLHDKAHANCIVANSIKSEVLVEPRVGDG